MATPEATAVGVIAELLQINPDSIDEDVLIRDELGVDSLRAMEIIAACETALKIDIDERRCAEFETVGEFVGYVKAVWMENERRE